LPEWYGNNLDALWDALTGLIETPVEIKIVFHPKTMETKKLKPAVESVIRVFREAEITYHEIHLEVDNQ
jgi:ribonuclease inhibitor